jgi:hypothetical protein
MVKNIVIVTQYFAPAWAYGGPPKELFILAKELVKQGIKVTVITSDSMDDSRNTITDEILDGIQVYRFKSLSNLLAFKYKLIIIPNIIHKVINLFDKTDLVIFSDVRAILNWQLYPYILKKNIPYGVFAFGELPVGFGKLRIIKQLFDLIWTKEFITKASYRFAQTEHEQVM